MLWWNIWTRRVEGKVFSVIFSALPSDLSDQYCPLLYFKISYITQTTLYYFLGEDYLTRR